MNTANTESPERRNELDANFHDNIHKVLMLLMSLALATLAFVVNQLTDKDFAFTTKAAMISILVGVILLFISITILLRVLFLRVERAGKLVALVDAKSEDTMMKTIFNAPSFAAYSRTKELKSLNRKIRIITSFSVLMFYLGEVFTITGFVLQVLPKINAI